MLSDENPEYCNFLTVDFLVDTDTVELAYAFVRKEATVVALLLGRFRGVEVPVLQLASRGSSEEVEPFSRY